MVLVNDADIRAFLIMYASIHNVTDLNLANLDSASAGTSRYRKGTQPKMFPCASKSPTNLVWFRNCFWLRIKLDQHRNLNSLLLVRHPSPGKELEIPAKFAELPLFLSGKNFSAKFLLLHCDADHRQNVII